MPTSLCNKDLAESRAEEARIAFAERCRDGKCHMSFNMADGRHVNLWIPHDDAIKLRDNLTRVVEAMWEVKRNDLRFELDEREAEVARLKRELASLRPKEQNPEVDKAERVSETV